MLGIDKMLGTYFLYSNFEQLEHSSTYVQNHLIVTFRFHAVHCYNNLPIFIKHWISNTAKIILTFSFNEPAYYWLRSTAIAGTEVKQGIGFDKAIFAMLFVNTLHCIFNCHWRF